MNTELARSCGYVLAVMLFLIVVLHVFWALGGLWGLQTAVGAGNPLPSRPLTWAVVAALLAAELTVLGALGLWGSRLPAWLFHWGTWALCLVFLGAAGLNARTGRPWEVYAFAPISLLMASLAAVVAVWASPKP